MKITHRSHYIKDEFTKLFIGGGGGLSDFVVVPSDSVLSLPDNVPLDVGGMVRQLHEMYMCYR